ncbi:transposon, En/Spm-like protein [Tanacetum coccineum]
MVNNIYGKKRSIFFDLPYWEYNLLRHNLDVMHIKKNIFDNLFGTLMNWDGKSKDNENSCKDLKEIGIRHDLYVINLPNKNPYLPPTCYSMSNVENTSFLQVLKNLKVPDGYASNISRGVSLKDHKILNLKSHDGHILMQDILPIALRASMVSRSQSRVVKAVSDLCSFFNGLCVKVLDVNELETLEHHAKLDGPIQYRWMYPIEGFLMRLKSYVRNKAQPEGSIAEGYIKEECLTFCARYFEGVETFMNRPRRNDGIIPTKEMYMLNSGGRKLGKVEIVELDGTLFAQAHRYVLLNHPKIQPLRVRFYNEQQALRNEQMSLKTMEKLFVQKFSWWLKQQLTDIIELEYFLEHKVVLFRCDWVDMRHSRGIKKDKYGFPLVTFSRPFIHTGESLKDDPFIIASYAQQVFYIEDPKDVRWWHIIMTKPRDTYDMGINVNMDEDDDDDELYTECMPYNFPIPDDINETPSWHRTYIET